MSRLKMPHPEDPLSVLANNVRESSSVSLLAAPSVESLNSELHLVQRDGR